MDETKKTAARMADGFNNFTARVGTQSSNVLSNGTYDFNNLSNNRLQLEAMYRTSWVVGKMIDIKAEDMTREGATFTASSMQKPLDELTATIEDLGIWQSLGNLERWGNLYGGSIAVIEIDGHDKSTPLDIATIVQGQFTGLSVFDRWSVNPLLSEFISTGPERGLPKYYDLIISAQVQLAGKQISPTGVERVHHSRIIRGVGYELPYWQAVQNMMWGQSIIERLYDRLVSYDHATMSAANLIERANNRFIGVENLREVVSAGGDVLSGLVSYFDMMREFMTNEGLTIHDKNDVTASTSYTFAGLNDLLLQFGQQMSGACDIPLVRMFGQSPAGLSATGDSDLRNYYDGIKSKQISKLSRGVKLVSHCAYVSTYGEMPPKDFRHTFNPLWQKSDAEKSDYAVKIETSMSHAMDVGLIKKSTALKELHASAQSTGIFSTITQAEIDEADADSIDMPPPAIEKPVTETVGEPSVEG